MNSRRPCAARPSERPVIRRSAVQGFPISPMLGPRQAILQCSQQITVLQGYPLLLPPTGVRNVRRDAVIAQTRAWVDRAVIGLNLCPFAKAPQVKGLVRYVVSDATDPPPLLPSLTPHLNRLVQPPTPSIETTLPT